MNKLPSSASGASIFTRFAEPGFRDERGQCDRTAPRGWPLPGICHQAVRSILVVVHVFPIAVSTPTLRWRDVVVTFVSVSQLITPRRRGSSISWPIRVNTLAWTDLVRSRR